MTNTEHLAGGPGNGNRGPGEMVYSPILASEQVTTTSRHVLAQPSIPVS